MKYIIIFILFFHVIFICKADQAYDLSKSQNWNRHAYSKNKQLSDCVQSLCDVVEDENTRIFVDAKVKSKTSVSPHVLATYDTFIKQHNIPNFKKKFDKYWDNIQQNYESFVNNLLKYIENKDFAITNKEIISFANFGVFIKNFSDVASIIEEDENGNSVIYEDKMKKIFKKKGFSDKTIEWLIQMKEYYLTLYINATQVNYDSFPPDYFKKKNLKLSIEENAKNTIKKLNEKKDFIIKKRNCFLYNLFFKDILKLTEQNDKDFTLFYLNNLANKERLSDQIYDLIKNDEFMQLLSENSVNFNEQIDWQNIKQKILQNVEKKGEFYRLKTEVKAEINKKKEEYYNFILNIFSFLPTEKELEEIKVAVEKNKNDYLQKVSALFSQTTINLLKQRFNNIEFILPPSKKEFLKDIQYMIDSLNYENKEDFNPTFPNKGEDFKRQYLLTYCLYEYDDSEDLFSVIDVNKWDIIKKHYLTENILHYNFSNKNHSDYKEEMDKYIVNLNLELFHTLAESHEFIIKHELSHIFFYFLQRAKISEKSKNKFKKILQCLDKKNIFNHASYEGFINDVLEDNVSDKYKKRYDFLDEIWSDEFAISKNNLTSINSFCYAIKDPDGVYYDSYTLDGENHPSLMWRLLNIEKLTRGTLPSECSTIDLFDELGKKMTFKSCLSN